MSARKIRFERSNKSITPWLKASPTERRAAVTLGIGPFSGVEKSESADVEFLLTPTEWAGGGVPDVLTRLSAQVAVDMLQLCQAHAPEGRAAMTEALKGIYNNEGPNTGGRYGYSTMASVLDLVRNVGRLQMHAHMTTQDSHTFQNEEVPQDDSTRGANPSIETTNTLDDEPTHNKAVADDDRDMIHYAQLCVG